MGISQPLLDGLSQMLGGLSQMLGSEVDIVLETGKVRSTKGRISGGPLLDTE